MPPFNKTVLFRGIITWKSKLNPIDFFDDELTHDTEDLDYGVFGYVLNRNSDWLVSNDPNIENVCDQFVTHWCEIPEELLKN